MVYRKKLLLLVLVVGLVVTACVPGNPAQGVATPQPQGQDKEISHSEEIPYPVNSDQISATNAMGFDLLRRIDEAADPGTNLFISPASVALALAMTANGTDGDTYAAMLEALHLAGWDEADMNEAMAGLRQALTGGDLGVELAIANSLWLREGMNFYEAFLEANRTYYDARVEALDFDNPEASRIINRWVEDQTNGLIPEIVPAEIDPDTILFLINAIYFKGDWARPFNEDMTSTETFVRTDGADISVPMMSQTGRFRYQETDDYQTVRLAYAGDRLSMIVVLPAEGRDVDDLVSMLDAATWVEMVTSLGISEGTVALPRFTLSFETVLNDPLSAMGMGIAFERESADFSRIDRVPPAKWISEVRHKTFVDVNEQGTEAAAVTSVEVVAESMPVDFFTFRADRPFVYGIQDDLTGSILFFGVMHDPLQTEAEVL